MIVLDTNVLSALIRPVPEPIVVTWLNRQPRMSIWTNSITILEVRFGLRIMPDGKRRSAFLHALDLILGSIEHRIAAFDDAAAKQSAELMAARRKRGRPREFRDTMIAGIVLAQHATLATRNTSDFSDISAAVVNPWAA